MRELRVEREEDRGVGAIHGCSPAREDSRGFGQAERDEASGSQVLRKERGRVDTPSAASSAACQRSSGDRAPP